VIPDKRDLAKLLVMDFMLIMATTTSSSPSIFRWAEWRDIDELLVHDVVRRHHAGGSRPMQRPPGGRALDLFLDLDCGSGWATGRLLVLPPSAGPVPPGRRSIEDVRFVRDEQANLVWAIEQTTEGGEGRPWPGRERHVASTARNRRR
jgi:hypothetical protein